MNLTRRRIEQINAPDNFANALVEVVDDHSQMVGDQTIPSPDHEVAGFGFQALALCSLKRINKLDWRIICADPYGKLVALTAVSTGAWIYGTERSLLGRSKVPAGAGAGISKASRLQLCYDLVVPCCIVALVGDRAVPLEAVALQCSQNLIDGTFLLPRRVDVLDSQEPPSGPGFRL